MMKRTARFAAVVGAGLLLSAGVGVSPASAEPNPGAGRSSDAGTGGTLFPDGSADYSTIYGTWYNCGSAKGTDHKRIDVSLSTDDPCVAIPYGSSGSSTFERDKVLPSAPDPYYHGWKNC